jgi:hypothetical protein
MESKFASHRTTTEKKNSHFRTFSHRIRIALPSLVATNHLKPLLIEYSLTLQTWYETDHGELRLEDLLCLDAHPLKGARLMKCHQGGASQEWRSGKDVSFKFQRSIHPCSFPSKISAWKFQIRQNKQCDEEKRLFVVSLKFEPRSFFFLLVLFAERRSFVQLCIGHVPRRGTTNDGQQSEDGCVRDEQVQRAMGCDRFLI